MRLINAVLFWIDQSPLRYWVVALSAYAFLLGFCLWPLVLASVNLQRHRLLRWLGNDALFLAMAAAVIFAFRWPLLAFPAELNPDESCFIRDALTLRYDPVFWRSNDPALCISRGILAGLGLAV